MLWDTAGQEEFDAITKAYYRGTIGNLFFWLDKEVLLFFFWCLT